MYMEEMRDEGEFGAELFITEMTGGHDALVDLPHMAAEATLWTGTMVSATFSLILLLGKKYKASLNSNMLY